MGSVVGWLGGWMEECQLPTANWPITKLTAFFMAANLQNKLFRPIPHYKKHYFCNPRKRGNNFYKRVK